MAIEGDFNAEVELLEPWRIQVNYVVAVERNDLASEQAGKLVDLVNNYAERLGLSVEFGYIMQMDREDVIPGSDIDERLRENTRPSYGSVHPPHGGMVEGVNEDERDAYVDR